MKRLVVLVWLAVCAAQLWAAELSGDLNVAHIAADRWRVDYALAEPVDALELEPNAGDYRTRAWHVSTEGVALYTQAPAAAVIKADAGKRFSNFSVEVSMYLPYAEGGYTPFERFSDGGAAMYLGFFSGKARQGDAVRPLKLTVHAVGLAGETVLVPSGATPGALSYAYFGTAKPVAYTNARLIADPRTPPWLLDMLRETTEKVTDVYARALARKPASVPLVMIALGDMQRPGVSAKGGVVGNAVVYRWEGQQLFEERPPVRRAMSKLVAHELAHVWQNAVARGGIGEEAPPWVHEGGAEALAVAALQQSGLYTDADAAEVRSKLLAECEHLNGSVESYRGYYACGFARFTRLAPDVLALWREMMKTTEATGATYSPEMVDRTAAQLAAAAR